MSNIGRPFPVTTLKQSWFGYFLSPPRGLDGHRRAPGRSEALTMAAIGWHLRFRKTEPQV